MGKETKFILKYLFNEKYKFMILVFVLLIRSLSEGITLGALSPLLRVLFGIGGAPEFLTRNEFLKPVSYFLQRFVFMYTGFEALKKVAILVVIIYIFRFFIMYIDNIMNFYFGETILKDLRIDFFKKLLKKPIIYFKEKGQGEIIAKFVNDANYLREGYINGIAVLTREVFLLIVYLSLSIIISWKLTIIAFLAFPILSIFFYFINKKIRKRSKRLQDNFGIITQNVSEAISGIKIMKAFSKEEQETDKFNKNLKRYFLSTIKYIFASGLSSPSVEILTAIVGVVFLLIGGRLIFIEKSISADQFLVFIASIASMMGPLKRIFWANSYIQQAITASSRMIEIFEDDINPEYIGKIKFEGFKDKIRLKNVYFSYKDTNALKDINLEIKKGEWIAIIGPSGSGKSTLLDILSKFYLPDKGNVMVDGIDLKEIDTRSYRNKIGIIPQENFLFNDTLFNNLLYGINYKDEEELKNTLKKLGFQRTISHLKDNVSSLMGERGSMLSGGEKQMVSIIRAMLKEPDIIIMDEPTSSMDTISEKKFARILKDIFQGKTLLLIAHRPSTVMIAKRVIVMSNGKIICDGMHSELLKKCRLYRELLKQDLI